jgi:hypothetical protein
MKQKMMEAHASKPPAHLTYTKSFVFKSFFPAGYLKAHLPPNEQPVSEIVCPELF